MSGKNWDSGNGSLMNLLHSDSDSDAVELLNLPPLKKVTKPKKRKKNSSSPEICSLWFLIKTVIVLSLIGVSGFIGVMTYKLTNNIKQLEERIKTLEGTVEHNNDGAPSQWQALQTQVTACNKSVKDLRTGDKGLDEVVKNLTRISEQVKIMLTEMKTKSQDGDGENSNDDHVSRATFAGLGSRVEGLDSEVKAAVKKQEEMNTKLSELVDNMKQFEDKSKMIAPEPTGGAMSADEKSNFIQLLTGMRQSIDLTNTTLSSHLDSMNQELTSIQGRLDTLEKAASVPHVALNTTVLTETVKTQLIPYIQMQVDNATHSTSTTTFDPTVLDSIKFQVQNITQAVILLEKQISQNKGQTTDDEPESGLPSLSSIVSQLNATDLNLQYLNETVQELRNETDRLTNFYVQEKNDMVKLNSQVEGIKRFIHALSLKNGLMTETNTSISSTTPPPQDKSTESFSPSTKRNKRGVNFKSDLDKELEDLFA